MKYEDDRKDHSSRSSEWEEVTVCNDYCVLTNVDDIISSTKNALISCIFVCVNYFKKLTSTI